MQWSGIKSILNTLGELYFAEKADGQVRLSTLDATRLADLDAGAKSRWVGGDRRRHKLSTFGGIRKITSLFGLQATLRDYQLEGVAWVQFLHRYDLAGILPDDMGLGKTMQTLAHILLEKQGDATRCTLLGSSIKPFLLRGIQDKVAIESPPKNEVVLSVTLIGAQNDLYENVRLVTDKKVREEVAKKGVALSYIVILESLLKLRQACCDPLPN